MSKAERWATTMKTELLCGRGVDFHDAEGENYRWANAAETEAVFGWVREARVIDLVGIDLLNEVCNGKEEGLPIVSTPSNVDRALTLDDVPFVAQPVIALPGWYQISDTLAITVWSTEVPNESQVWHSNLLALMDGVTGDDPRVLVLPARGEIWTKPEELQITAHAIYLDPAQDAAVRASEDAVIPTVGERLPDLLNWLLAQLGTILLVNSMVTLDPGVAVTSTIPAKVWAKSVRSHPGRVRSRSITSIHLPGLRYDRKAGRWVGTNAHGVAYHWVRGFYRTLKSPRYGANVGKRVFVHPHARGDKSVGVSTRPYELDL